MKHSETLIKIALSLLLFLCLLNMPYGYYQFVRFLALIGFAVLSYQANQDGKKNETQIYAALALFVQPFFKIALGRDFWNILDVIVAVGLIMTIFIKQKLTES